jgi:hypothetical protein
MSSTSTSVGFLNNTDLPIGIESWMSKSSGLSVLNEIVIQPGEKTIVYSSVNEWIISLYHLSENEYSLWKKKHFFSNSSLRIGKFSSKKYIMGDYGIFDWCEFECIMQNGIIVFQYNKDYLLNSVPETNSDGEEESIKCDLSDDQYSYQNIIHGHKLKENDHSNCLDDCIICKAIF